MATIGSFLQMLTNSQNCEFLVEKLLLLTYDVFESKIVCVIIGPNSPWYQETFTYLRDSIISPHLTKTQQQTFIRRSTWYTILGDTLFRRHFDGSLRRYLDKEEVERELREVYKGIYGAHSSDLMLVKKLLRTRYYWPTMEEDAYHYVKKCIPY